MIFIFEKWTINKDFRQIFFNYILKRQNRIFYYITIKLRTIYLFERRNFLYWYYRISKFQLYTIWNNDEILINTLYFSLLNFSNLNLHIFELLFRNEIWKKRENNVTNMFKISIKIYFINENLYKLTRFKIWFTIYFWHSIFMYIFVF